MARKPHPISHIIRWLSRADAILEIKGLQPSTYKHIKADALMYLQCWQQVEGMRIASDVADVGIEIEGLRQRVEMLESDLATTERLLAKAEAKIASLEGDNTTEYAFWKKSDNYYDFLKCAECGQDLAAPVLEKWNWCPSCGRMITRKG